MKNAGDGNFGNWPVTFGASDEVVIVEIAIE